MSRARLRWGDTLDDDDILPPSQTEGPDEHGVKKIIEYVKNDKGDTIKRVTRVKIATIEKKVYEVTAERAKWPKFGAAAAENSEQITMKAEEIPFEKVRNSRSSKEEKKSAKAAEKPAVNLKEILQKKRLERELLRAKGLYKEDVTSEMDGKATMGATGKPGKYVAPHKSGTDGAGARKHDENAIRVSNLPEGTKESDLRELFSPFGNISRVHIVTDPITKGSRGFAFINYHHRESALHALALHGFGYDNVILKVEWSERKEPR
mmetsp:Transcript_13018/g.23150  ORF Transcript_13018/g.23150 Transcript_13018/m.23150 type:complete len:264 (-) Transcript_13018:422-1213(-)|eukprot:CAMPEP_0175078290 /NCGR_PEP_ID=MMETSP0052_2-20121109/24014_1 /TAXON_ID=51329 ORGANISM="Polytomella parva, Strain SAG 63-3" /NCGR_SAMPLE_ID=MMETSP0052_2 /ASSEMBLY_ACC=CAM_ASM_000194 /LENGTH=263 /DNA_ID=CAMNT_0016348151 /DNA_START=23 /DNA_END=814 /DNA_ORIENTATION=+